MKGVNFVFYEIYCGLCEKNGLTPSGAAAKIGFNRASVTVWKNTGKAPKQELLLKIADYFGVTTDYLLGSGKKERPAEGAGLSDEEIRFALSGGDGPITDAQFEEVKKFVQFIKERDKHDQK